MSTAHAQLDLSEDAARFWRTLAIVAGILAVYNVIVNVFLPPALYVPVNLIVAALLLAVAGNAGLSRADVGLDAARVGSGLRWGLIAFGVVAVCLTVGALVPATRALFADDRVDLGAGAMLYQVLVRIPFGTVVLEEVAFRGVLLGVMLVRWRPFAAATGSSMAFGFWHVLPALGLVEANAGNATIGDLSGDLVFRIGAVAGAVVSTWIAGYIFSWLRLRSGSLLAPVLLHVATNSLGFAVAWTLFETS